jgi:ADYC domain
VYELAPIARDAVVPQTWLYELRYRDAEGGAWKSFCGADAQGKRWAIALSGTYDAANTAHPDDKHVTFACTRGVMAKCYRWGYRPWIDAEHAAAHQACIRMAMADYCGDGRSWTRDGTLIQHWDRLSPPVQPRTQLVPGMSFEAAWTPAGAACLSHRRWTGLDEEFGPQRCARPVPRCSSEQEAARLFGEALLFNASRKNRLR